MYLRYIFRLAYNLLFPNNRKCLARCTKIPLLAGNLLLLYMIRYGDALSLYADIIALAMATKKNAHLVLPTREFASSARAYLHSFTANSTSYWRKRMVLPQSIHGRALSRQWGDFGGLTTASFRCGRRPRRSSPQSISSTSRGWRDDFQPLL